MVLRAIEDVSKKWEGEGRSDKYAGRVDTEEE